VFDWSALGSGGGRESPRSITSYENHLYVTGSTSSFGAGKDDIFLLKYTSPNEAVSPLMTAITAAAIAVGLITWMTLILEAVK